MTMRTGRLEDLRREFANCAHKDRMPSAERLMPLINAMRPHYSTEKELSQAVYTCAYKVLGSKLQSEYGQQFIRFIHLAGQESQATAPPPVAPIPQPPSRLARRLVITAIVFGIASVTRKCSDMREGR